MAYANTIQKYLKNAGYNVTFMRDSQITLTFFRTQLNNYDIIIWRTNAYDWRHTIYWYLGELDNKKARDAYATDFASGAVDNTNGILGISLKFITEYYPAGSSLANVELFMIVSSVSAYVGPFLIKAGVKSVIDYYGAFSLSADIIDYITMMIVRFLAAGNTVKDAVMKTLSIFMNQRTPSQPLDPRSLPPMYYMGSGTLTIV